MMGCGVGGVFAVLGVVALVKFLVRGAGYRRMGCGGRHWGHHHHHGPFGGPYRRHGGWHGGDWGHGEEEGWDDQPPRGHRGRGRRKLSWLFERLDTTPEQERVLTETFRELKGSLQNIAEKAAASREEWASALESESFDEVMVGNAVAGFESAVDDARKTTLDAFAKVHNALDPSQRKQLARWLRSRGFAGFRGGPGRSVL